ncbi:MAG: DUF2480 family protein [Cyclobacteriaceae bacterium]|nr:DUF2480 family protein [Cyclobacteriaceae bacterium]
MSDPIVNRVANSPLVSLDLEQYYPEGERVVYDIKDNLYEETILREKDFRAFVKEHDWKQYAGKNVAITCSVDAIIPTWAYMLLASKISPVANYVLLGNLEDLERELFKRTLAKLNPEEFKDAKVVVKGCSDKSVPASAYVEIVRLLQPIVSSLMFGEPCSTVPVFKKPKE